MYYLNSKVIKTEIVSFRVFLVLLSWWSAKLIIKRSAFHLGQKATNVSPSHHLSLSAWLTHIYVTVTWPLFPVTDTGWSSLQQAGRNSWRPLLGSAQFQLYTVWPTYFTATLLKLSEALSAQQQGQRQDNLYCPNNVIATELLEPAGTQREFRIGNFIQIFHTISYLARNTPLLFHYTTTRTLTWRDR